MASIDIDNQEVKTSFIETETDISVDNASASDMQVKEEPEDTEYEQTSATSCLTSDNFTQDSRNSSLDHSPSQTSYSVSSVNQLDTITNPSSQIPLNDIFAGSTIRSQLHGAISGKKMDTVQNIVENLLKKNETLLALSDAGGFKPNARRARAAHDGFVKRTEPAFPSAGQASVFPVSHSLLAHVNASKGTSDTLKHHLVRPKSPTRRYDGMLKDKTHFTYALMESSATDHEIEKIFNVQNHELVCAVGSKTLITDNVNKIVASLEFCYFWCNFCPFSTNSKSLLTQHVLEHRFCCKYCEYESFCRSDIVRHMHKMHDNFKDTASHLSYLTLLSDYLRVKGKINEKENNDPDDDVSNKDQEKIDAVDLLDHEGPKRKSVFEKDECVSVVTKARRIDGENAAQKMSGISQGRQDMSRQSHSSYRPGPPTEADYDIFDMEVEDVTDSQLNLTTDESNTNKCVFSSNHTSTATSVKQASQTTGPHTQDKYLETFTTSHDSNTSGIYNTYQLHGSHNKSYPGSGTSSLYWNCGYCTFQSSSQTEIKDHSSKLHPGKPHRYVALIKNVTSSSSLSKNIKGSMPGSSSATSGSMNTSQLPQADHSSANVARLFQVSSDSKPVDAASSKTNTISVSENGASRSLLKVKINSSTLAKKGEAVFKCYHCLYTSRRHWTMKNHIYNKHRGMGLVAVTNGSSESRVFFCARDDCAFRSQDANVYLNHVDQCTPWNKPKLADVEVEPHIRECLDRTIALAEVSKVKEIEHAKSRVTKDTWNTVPENVTESSTYRQLLLKGKSPGENETNPLWIQNLESDVCHRAETPKLVKNSVDVCRVIGSDISENVYDYLCPQNLRSPVELELCSNNDTCIEVLPSEYLFHTPSPVENQEAEKHYVCSLQVSDRSDINTHDSNLCTAAAPEDKFTSDNCVGVTTRNDTYLSEHSELEDILIEHTESDMIKPCPGLIVTENRTGACSFSVNKVGLLPQEDLPTADSESVLTIENKMSTSDIKPRKNYNDLSMSKFIKCKDSNSAVDLDKIYKVKDLKNKEGKLKIAVLGKTDTSFMKSNVDAVTEKHESPSLKIKLKMVGHAAVYNLSKSTQQPEQADANRKIRSPDSITCDSSSSSGYSDEENITMQSDCTKASQIQNPWIKDLIDSTEDSDSDQAFHFPDSHDSFNSVPDRYTNSLEYTSDKESSILVCNTFKGNEASKNVQEQKSLCIEDNSNQCILPEDQFLTEKSETVENVTKPNYSFVPLRSAAVKAISKMKPLLTCETVDKEDSCRNNYRGKKPALKCKLSCPSSYLKTSHKSSASRKRKLLSGHKFASKMSKSVYMCQYCIDISEGPLEKIKSHVMSKHSSMPPMVINCFKQRHHISCQFYICPYDSCYKLTSTPEELETHKCTHEMEKSQKSSAELFENNLPFSANINTIKKVSTTKPVRACRVKLDILDMSKVSSVGSVLITPEKKKYQCLYCTSYYYDDTLQGMKAHYSQEHEGQLIVIRDIEARRSQLPSRIYVCDNPNCQHSYISRSDLDSHANSHKSNLTFIYECASCGWYSASHTAACHHVKTEHPDEEAVSLVHMQVSVDEYGQTSKIIL